MSDATPRASEAAAAPAWLSSAGATLMAIVNVNTDSFSDPRATRGGDDRLEVARAAIAAGAAVVDLGAQSAALAATLVPAAQQVAALVPLVAALAAEGIPVSVDTYLAEVATPVLAAGATIVNDYSGIPSPQMLAAVAEAGAYYVATHNPVGVRRRQTETRRSSDPVGEVVAGLEDLLDQATAAGVPRGRVLVDPGVDVGKTPWETLELLRARDRIHAEVDAAGFLWAISRKDVLGALTGRTPRQRDPGTLALLAALADRPRTLLRVHDVAACRDYLTVNRALAGEIDLDPDELLDDALRRED